MSIIGISNMVGRPFFGYLSDLPAVDALTVMYICTAASSLIAFFIPMCSSYYSLSAISAAFGLFSGIDFYKINVIFINKIFFTLLSIYAVCSAIDVVNFGRPNQYAWSFSNG